MSDDYGAQSGDLRCTSEDLGNGDDFLKHSRPDKSNYAVPPITMQIAPNQQSQLRLLVQTGSLFIKPNALASSQRILECPGNLNDHHPCRKG